MALADLFLPFAGDARARLEGSPELDATLERMLAAGRAAWPTVPLGAEVFLRHVAERARGEAEPLAALVATHASDLYLACALSHGDPAALAAFERHFVAQVSAYLGSARALAGFTDEVKQGLRTRLLVGQEGLLPRIASYTGRGPLAGWLRMAAARIAVDLRRGEKHHQSLDTGTPSALPAPTLDPEVDYLKTHYRKEFEDAFEATLVALSAREGNVLRLYFLESMNAEAIGALYRVSSRTVQRWIAETRQKILDSTHRILTERLALNASQVRSLMGLVQSQMDVSIHRFLKR